ncbi:MAG: response regulator transcription factor [Rhizobium sp.]|nr:MAG: response regulator transcription factor [Rhizobium sp.]
MKDLYSQKLSGKRLLIVEDGYFLTDETRRKLQRLGAVILGPVGDTDHAAGLVEAGEADAVILDLHLPVRHALRLVEQLEKRDLPYIFAIDREIALTTSGFSGFVLCEKSAAIEHIAEALFAERKRDI